MSWCVHRCYCYILDSGSGYWTRVLLIYSAYLWYILYTNLHNNLIFHKLLLTGLTGCITHNNGYT